MRIRKFLLFILLFVTGCFCLYLYGEKNHYLREVADKRNFLIGASVSASPFLHDDKYKTILKNEFNLLTIENDMKFSRIHPQRNTYDFSLPDLMVNFAEENDMKVRGHTLVWHHSNPDWLSKEKYSKEELSLILKNHIQTVVKHYGGKIYAWDVVNEAFNDDGTLRNNIWLQTIGPEYIELAFRWAHDADPNALLFYNDYSNEGINQKSNAIFRMLEDFMKRGVPIDGVGFQMHSDIMSPKDEEKIKENINRYKLIGLEVHITELDIAIQNSDKPYKKRLQQQAEMYSKILDVCLLYSNCTAMVTWGVTDKYSWIPEYSGQPDAPLLFDRDYEQKLSYKSIYGKLKK
ncbi:endo-1,4-beta-xylanase [Metabacillus sp. B2-18]|uniref:endo-1,4-beta-xylanase n=1 Tax=Metabacillus sp. B2-18 TaxID=2897333 RepID=UPI001E30B939|nr:endo-1,4-beta-xylanase [Metabacillus sp. B2-18]UGB29480.1 endo-1,4-beta-xylanase [Metabacillus sp. B2-18]